MKIKCFHFKKTVTTVSFTLSKTQWCPRQENRRKDVVFTVGLLVSWGPRTVLRERVLSVPSVATSSRVTAAGAPGRCLSVMPRAELALGAFHQQPHVHTHAHTCTHSHMHEHSPSCLRITQCWSLVLDEDDGDDPHHLTRELTRELTGSLLGTDSRGPWV